MTDDVKNIIARTIGIEGGYVNDPIDRGGETCWGISKRSYPHIDIKNLTLDGAFDIYERDYYNKLHLERINSVRVRWKVFDVAVNCGGKTAIRMLQKAAGVNRVDGILGNQTAMCVNAQTASAIIDMMVGQLYVYYADIVERDKSQSRFYHGWLRRAADVGKGFA